ncbi:MAG: OadG family protein [Mucispirillum sp.]|nr:OadG family protein [Mucispirillum sp.]
MAENISHYTQIAQAENFNTAVAVPSNPSRDWRDTLPEGLKVTAIGVGVVFAVLLIIIVFINIIKKLDYMWEHREHEEKLEKLDKQQNIDDTTLILISAAVAAYTHNQGNIRRIRVLPSKAKQGGSWAMQARSALQSSHTGRK